jgi:site-specific DNA-methyltransferase (adenine-specific)
MTTFEIYNADCLLKMKDIPNKSIDLIICDLPYGCLIGGGGEEKKRRHFINGKDTGTEIKQIEGVIAGCAWDIKLDLDAFWKEIKRIRKDDHTPCIHFCSTKFGYDLIKSNEKEFRYDLVWCKSNAVGFLSANKKPMASHEMIYIFSKKGANYNRVDIQGEAYFKKSKNEISNHYNAKRIECKNEGTRCVTTLVEVSKGNHKSKHPTAKPIEIYKWLIERYSKEGDKVLDPTFGSCHSGLACKELNRSYIGIEMDKVFFDKAVERIEE